MHGERPIMATEKQEMLFGFPAYEVRNAADDLTRADELKRLKPGIYDAALKYLAQKESAIGNILASARNSKRKNNG